MKKSFSASLVMFAIVFSCGQCFGRGSIPFEDRLAILAVTKGNSTFIPMSTSFSDALTANKEGHQIVQDVKRAFRDMHPELKVIRSREIIKHGKIYGIKIIHAPSKNKPLIKIDHTCSAGMGCHYD